MRGCAIAKGRRSRAEQSKRKETDGTETRDNVSLSPQQSLNFADMMSLCDQERAVSSGCCAVWCRAVLTEASGSGPTISHLDSR